MSVCEADFMDGVSRTFEVDGLEWNGMLVNVGLQVDAEVGRPYRDDSGPSRGDVEILNTHIATFEAFDEFGNNLPKFVDRLILEHCEGELIEAVTAKIGDIDIQDALLNAVGQ